MQRWKPNNMPTIIEEINKYNRDSMTNIVDGKITAYGTRPGRYKIRLQNGAVVENVSGPIGLNIDNAVAVAIYPGKPSQYVVINQLNKDAGEIKTVYV